MNLLLMSKTQEDNVIENIFFDKLGKIPTSLAYIPSKTDSSRKYFEKIKDHYFKIGVQTVNYCDFDLEFSDLSFSLLNESDGIYLSGGFTPYFVKQLQSNNVLASIKKLAQTGRPVIGVSAGAIIMGQDLEILNDDPAEGEATRALNNNNGVGLFDFEFWPHFGKNPDDESRLAKRSLTTGRKIYGCDDSSGIFCIDNNWSVINKVSFCEAGAVIKIDEVRKPLVYL